MYRVKATKVVDGVTTTMWYAGPNQLTNVEVMAKPYYNKGIAETGIKTINKEYPELVKGYTLETSEWP